MGGESAVSPRGEERSAADGAGVGSGTVVPSGHLRQRLWGRCWSADGAGAPDPAAWHPGALLVCG